MKKKIGIALAILAIAGIFVVLAFSINRSIYNSGAKQLYQAACQLFQKKDYQNAVTAYEKILNEFSKSSLAKKAQFGLAEAYSGLGRLAEARDAYRSLLSQDLDVGSAKIVYGKIGDLNIKILFSPVKTDDSVIYEVRGQDTLESIAKKYNTTVALIKKANNIKMDSIRSGMRLKVTTVNFSIVVDKSQNTLILKAGEELVKVYPVSTGKDNSTPVGTFKIVNKIKDPPWFSGGKAILPGDPKNILGSRWLGITIPSYGIHGTTDDTSIGSQCTQGCVRMHNSDVEELYGIVPVSTEVTIVD